jgi:hypothetical protein
MSVYLVALLIFWTAVIAGLVALIRRVQEGHDPKPVNRRNGRPGHTKAA